MAAARQLRRAVAAAVVVTGIFSNAPSAHAVEFDQTIMQAPKGQLALEIARTPEQRRYGFMQRAVIPNGHGMVFVYDEPQEVRMWMFNTLVPLDMVFLSDGHVVGVEERTLPCPMQPCRIYASGAPVDAVIEVGAGQAEALGLELGAFLPSLEPSVRMQRGAGAPVTDSYGNVWNAYSHEEFLALPQVRQFDAVIGEISAGPFKGMNVVESEGDRMRQDIIYRDEVTRVTADRTKRSWTITYVEGNRQCTRVDRTAGYARPTADARAEFACGKAKRRAVRGEEFARDLLASQIPAPALGGAMAYLVRSNPVLPAGGLAAMEVIVVGADYVKSMGVSNLPPQTRTSIVIRPDRLDNDIAESNGMEWQYRYRTLESRGVPRLPVIDGL